MPTSSSLSELKAQGRYQRAIRHYAADLNLIG